MRSSLLALAVAACAPAPVASPVCPGAPLASRVTPYEPPGTHRDAAIVEVDLAGVADPELAATLRGVIKTKVADRLATAPVADDLRRLWGLGMLSDARVEVRGERGGVALTFVVEPQPMVDRVTVVGERGDALPLRRLRWLTGTPYEPERIARVASAIRDAYVHDGHVDARVEARRIAALGVALCVAVDPGPRVTIGSLRFSGNGAVSVSRLRALVESSEGGVNHVGGLYDRAALDAAMLRIAAEYYELGRIAVHVAPPRVTRRGSALDIAIAIHEGPQFRVGRVALATLGGGRVALRVRPGDVFARSQISAEVARLEVELGPGASVTPETAVDHHAARVDLTFHVDWRWPWHMLRWLSAS